MNKHLFKNIEYISSKKSICGTWVKTCSLHPILLHPFKEMMAPVPAPRWGLRASPWEDMWPAFLTAPSSVLLRLNFKQVQPKCGGLPSSTKTPHLGQSIFGGYGKLRILGSLLPSHQFAHRAEIQHEERQAVTTRDYTPAQQSTPAIRERCHCKRTEPLTTDSKTGQVSE